MSARLRSKQSLGGATCPAHCTVLNVSL